MARWRSRGETGRGCPALLLRSGLQAQSRNADAAACPVGWRSFGGSRAGAGGCRGMVLVSWNHKQHHYGTPPPPFPPLGAVGRGAGPRKGGTLGCAALRTMPTARTLWPPPYCIILRKGKGNRSELPRLQNMVGTVDCCAASAGVHRHPRKLRLAVGLQARALRLRQRGERTKRERESLLSRPTNHMVGRRVG